MSNVGVNAKMKSKFYIKLPHTKKSGLKPLGSSYLIILSENFNLRHFDDRHFHSICLKSN